MFGTPSTPGFGTPTSTPGFGTPSSTPAFGTPSSTPAFGTSFFGTPSTPAFGTPSSTPAFGAPSATPAFGTPSSNPAFGTPSSTPAFGAPSATPAFGSSSTPGFGTPSIFGSGPSPFFQQQQQQPQQQQISFSLFPQQQPSASPFGNAQITTQMAPVAPLTLALADRDLTAIIDAYKDDPGNPKYSFRHLLLSVTDPAARVKPVGASDIIWAEAMGKLEGMQSSDRERLWPQLVQGFKDLSYRLKLQDEVIVSDVERLRATQSNVRMLIRHLQTDAIPWGQRLKQKEQGLQRRLLRLMRIVEVLEGKGSRMPLVKEEVELADKLAAISKQLKGPGAEVSRRVHNLLSVSRVHANGGGLGSAYLPASAKIDEQSLADLQEALQQQTEAIARLGMVLKRDTRDVEIIMSEGSGMLENGGSRQTSRS